MRWLLLLCCLPLYAKPLWKPATHWEEPWGRDAPLARKAASEPHLSPLQQVATHLIHFHQKVISPANGPRSKFVPSSSQYTLLAIQRYGFVRGFVMGCNRLMRENSDPWLYPTTRFGPYTRKQDLPYVYPASAKAAN